MAQLVVVWVSPRLMRRCRLMAAVGVVSHCWLGADSSVGYASGSVAGEPGDGPFCGRPQVPVGVLRFFFGPAGLVRRPTVVVSVDFDGPSVFRGGASCPQGAAVAPFGERGGTSGTYAGGVAGGTRHCPGSGVDPEVVAVEPVFDVGFAYDWFHHRGVTKIVERFETSTGRVRRIGDDFGFWGVGRQRYPRCCRRLGCWQLLGPRR